MKKSVITTTTFNPSTGVIDTGIENFDIRKLYAIINQTAKALIFATGVQGKGFVSITGSTIQLEVNTTSMNSTDKLQILYDEDSEEAEWLENIYMAVDQMTFLQQLRTTTNALRVSVAEGNMGNIGTVTAINNLASQGGFLNNQIVPSTVNIGAIQSNINNIIIT